jgi:N-acetylmuramoyl-L-alanine amidase
MSGEGRAICAAMKCLSAVLMLASLLWVRPVAAAVIGGQNYVSLADWAHANGFGGYTRNHGGEVVMTNRTARLIFDVNSATAEINGVEVRLSYPIANTKNGPCISALDIDTTIRPLVFAPKPLNRRIKTICLDPGHGGNDTGNRVGHGFFAHNEKTYTLALALELGSQLRGLGFNVVFTRTKDERVELPVRPAIANRNGADLFVSLHFNASPADPKEVSGPETYCITPVGASSSNAQGEGADHGAVVANRLEDKSLLLAYQIQKSLVNNLGVPDREVRRARFAVLRDAEMPAILIEGGYMTHPVEGRKIFDAKYRKQMATAILKGILNYQKLTAPPAPPRSNPAGTNKMSTAARTQ